MSNLPKIPHLVNKEHLEKVLDIVKQIEQKQTEIDKIKPKAKKDADADKAEKNPIKNPLQRHVGYYCNHLEKHFPGFKDFHSKHRDKDKISFHQVDNYLNKWCFEKAGNLEQQLRAALKVKEVEIFPLPLAFQHKPLYLQLEQVKEAVEKRLIAFDLSPEEYTNFVLKQLKQAAAEREHYKRKQARKRDKKEKKLKRKLELEKAKELAKRPKRQKKSPIREEPGDQGKGVPISDSRKEKERWQQKRIQERVQKECEQSRLFFSSLYPGRPIEAKPGAHGRLVLTPDQYPHPPFGYPRP